MQIEIPDQLIDVFRDALVPVVDRLVDERVEQRRPLLLSITQVADELSCSRASVFGLIHGGHLEAIRTGRTYRVATVTLQEYVEQLSRPTFERDVVGARRRQTTTQRNVRSGHRGRSRQSPTTSVIEATRPPRPPRPKQQRMSKKEIAEEQCSIAKFAGRWWGLESARALIERSGVALQEGEDGQMTFRYGDLVEWMEGNSQAFHEWVEEFDPQLNPR